MTLCQVSFTSDTSSHRLVVDHMTRSPHDLFCITRAVVNDILVPPSTLQQLLLQAVRRDNTADKRMVATRLVDGDESTVVNPLPLENNKSIDVKSVLFPKSVVEHFRELIFSLSINDLHVVVGGGQCPPCPDTSPLLISIEGNVGAGTMFLISCCDFSTNIFIR